MKKLINRVEEVENEMVAGLVKAFPRHVRKLEGGNTVVRAEKRTDKVALVSGGGRHAGVQVLNDFSFSGKRFNALLRAQAFGVVGALAP